MRYAIGCCCSMRNGCDVNQKPRRRRCCVTSRGPAATGSDSVQCSATGSEGGAAPEVILLVSAVHNRERHLKHCFQVRVYSMCQQPTGSGCSTRPSPSSSCRQVVPSQQVLPSGSWASGPPCYVLLPSLRSARVVAGAAEEPDSCQ